MLQLNRIKNNNKKRFNSPRKQIFCRKNQKNNVAYSKVFGLDKKTKFKNNFFVRKKREEIEGSTID